MVSRSSPMPNRPITTTRKLMPRRSSSNPKVSRRLPEIVSMPTAAKAKPSRIETSVFIGLAPDSPTKLAKTRR
jgi:hypothetical protein